jgi:hypothetical protein
VRAVVPPGVAPAAVPEARVRHRSSVVPRLAGYWSDAAAASSCPPSRGGESGVEFIEVTLLLVHLFGKYDNCFCRTKNLLPSSDRARHYSLPLPQHDRGSSAGTLALFC